MKKSLLMLFAAGSIVASAAPTASSPLTSWVNTVNEPIIEQFNAIVPNDEGEDVDPPATIYAQPWGTFFAGYTEDGYRLNIAQVQIPPFTELKFINKTPASQGWSTVLWKWATPENWLAVQPNGELADQDTLKVTYTHTKNNAFNMPFLTVTNAAGDSTFQTAPYMRVVNEPFSSDVHGSYHFMNTSPVWGSSFASKYYSNYNSASYWAGIFPNATNVRAAGFAEMNQTPASPYVLKRVMVRAYQKSGDTWNDDATLRIQQVRINEATGGIQSVVKTLGTFTCSKDNVVELSATTRLLTFDIYTIDEDENYIDGMLINTAIMSTFSVPEDGTTEYAMLYCPVPYNDTRNNHLYVNLKYTDDSGDHSIVRASSLKFTSGYARAFQFNYEASFEWLRDSETFENEGTWEAPAGGDSKFVTLLASQMTDEWWIGPAEGDELPDWLSVNAIDNFDDEGTEYNGTGTLCVTAEPLPDGVNSRECDIQVSYLGAKYVLHVTQGTPGIYGDVNGDGEVTVGDVSAIYDIILGLSEEYKDKADINGDGEVTVGDVSAIYDIILGA